MANAKKDQNHVSTLIGVSSVDNTTPTLVAVNPVNGRMLVDLPGGSSGTVTTVSVTSANGFAGSVGNPTTTPAITLSTTVTGITKGDGTALSAAVAGTDYIVGGTQTVGNLIFVDNTYDIGATGATRPKNVYIAGGLAVNTATATAGIVNVATGFRIANTATAGSLLRGDGTNYIATTAGYPNTAGTSGNVLTSDGTNWASSAPTVAIGTQVTGLGTGVATALAVNVGSAGAFVALNGALGTPSSGTLTNATGLPIAGLVASTSTAIGVGSVELGNATDTTLSRSSGGVLAVEGVVIPSISSTNTLTNKRVTRRLTTTNVPGATPTTNTDNVDIMNFTGLGAAITSMTTNLSGTPVDGDLVEFRFTDDGTARAITWGTSFAATTVALPTTTVISTMLRVLFEWNSTASKWQCIAVA